MNRLEWKEFWELVEVSGQEYNCNIHKVEADGGWRVLVLSAGVVGGHAPIPTTEEIQKEGILVASARYGLRGDEGENHYHQMLKIQWESDGPVPFGTSKMITIYVSPVPSAVFAILYA